MVACCNDRQLYVADENWRDYKDNCIWRVSADDHSDRQKWLSITREGFPLSLTSRRLLMASCSPARLRQYSTTDRQLLRVVRLPRYMKGLYMGVETTRGSFVVSYWKKSLSNLWTVSEMFSNFIILHILWYCRETQAWKPLFPPPCNTHHNYNILLKLTHTPSCMCTQLGTQFKPGTLPTGGSAPLVGVYSNKCPSW